MYNNNHYKAPGRTSQKSLESASENSYAHCVSLPIKCNYFSSKTIGGVHIRELKECDYDLTVKTDTMCEHYYIWGLLVLLLVLDISGTST